MRSKEIEECDTYTGGAYSRVSFLYIHRHSAHALSLSPRCGVNTRRAGAANWDPQVPLYTLHTYSSSNRGEHIYVYRRTQRVQEERASERARGEEEERRDRGARWEIWRVTGVGAAAEEQLRGDR